MDRLSKMVHFAPCTKEISAEKYAQLFIDHVFKHHGLPEVIISDRDPRFTSRFWKELFQKLGTDLRFSTAFHPQTDGQSEVTIRVLENFLRPYVERSPHTWVQQLPLVEFAVNNAVSISTWVHSILSEHRLSSDHSGVDACMVGCPKVHKRGSERDA